MSGLGLPSHEIIIFFNSCIVNPFPGMLLIA